MEDSRCESRAQCLAYVVCSPRLLEVDCRTIEHLKLADALCRFDLVRLGLPGRVAAGGGEAFLRVHRGEVAFVTIDIGGNDVIATDGGGVAAIQANPPVILAQLRAAAGPGVPIVGMSYYHPFLPDVWFGTHDPAALQGEVDSAIAFNDLLASLYAAAGDPVAKVEAVFSTGYVAGARRSVPS